MPKHLVYLLLLLLIVTTSGHAKKSSKKQKKVARVEKPAVTLADVRPEENVWGIDVSHHQSNINWIKLKEENPDFMFIKASEGVTLQDKRYVENYTEAKKHGILVGSYHFFSYKSSGKEQANNFLSIAQHKDSDLLPVLDAEFSKVMPQKDKVVDELVSFVNTIYEKLGHYPIIYCNHRFYNLYLKEKLSDKCKLWIVNYQGKPTIDWSFWQSTDRLKLEGITGFVDLNMFNGKISSLKNYFYYKTKENL